MNWWAALLVFVAMVLSDIAYARYTIDAVARRAHWASMWAAAIIAMSGVVVMGYTQDKRLLFFAVAGAYVGTFLAVRRKP